MTFPICCGNECRLTNGAEVYPRRKDLHGKPIWLCDSCGAYVGCHPKTTKPLGNPAHKETRNARMILHNRRLDVLWKGQPKGARNMTYAYLASRMGISREECHTGLFTIEQCRAAWSALEGATPEIIAAWYRERKAA